MNDFNSVLDQSEQETIATYEVSDEILEAAGSASQAGIYTLGACTGLSACPG